MPLRLRLQALTPLTIGRNRAAASALGALWGFGHSTGQLILGIALVLLKASSKRHSRMQRPYNGSSWHLSHLCPLTQPHQVIACVVMLLVWCWQNKMQLLEVVSNLP